MWIRSSLVTLLLLIAVAAAAQIGQNIGGGIGNFDNGINKGAGGNKGIPNPCTGVINLSLGCTLGVIP